MVSSLTDLVLLLLVPLLPLGLRLLFPLDLDRDLILNLLLEGAWTYFCTQTGNSSWSHTALRSP